MGPAGERPGHAAVVTKDLSVKATARFLSRARRGSLRFPKGFLEALDENLAKMEGKALSA